MARVNSLIRRYTLLNPVSGSQADCMTFQGMTIDSRNRIVLQGNEQIELTGKEFDLLFFLASNKGRVFTKKQIYTQVWAEEYDFDDSNMMSFISKKSYLCSGSKKPLSHSEGYCTFSVFSGL